MEILCVVLVTWCDIVWDVYQVVTTMFAWFMERFYVSPFSAVVIWKMNNFLKPCGSSDEAEKEFPAECSGISLKHITPDYTSSWSRPGSDCVVDEVFARRTGKGKIFCGSCKTCKHNFHILMHFIFSLSIYQHGTRLWLIV